MRIRDIFLIVWIVYSLPFMFSTILYPGPFDFIFTEWGWSVELYLFGLFLGVGISVIIMKQGVWQSSNKSGEEK